MTQLATVHGLEYPCINKGSATIPAGRFVREVITPKMGAALGPSTYPVALPITSGDEQAFGVSMFSAVVGAPINVRTTGTAVVTAHGAVTQGDLVCADTAAGYEGFAKTAGLSKYARGKALNDAVDGGDVLVLLFDLLTKPS